MNIVKRLGNYIAAIFKLGRTERLAKQAGRDTAGLRRDVFDHINRLSRRIDSGDAIDAALGPRQQQFEDRLLETTRGTLRDLRARHAELARSYSDLSQRLDWMLLGLAGTAAGVARPQIPQTPETPAAGLDALRDSVLVRLEALTPQTTKPQLSVLLPAVEIAVLRAGEAPVLDLYAGDGAWLALLGQAGLPATAAHDAPGTALQTWTAEARTTLADARDGSLSVLCARNLLTGLPFDEVLWLMREAQRVLAPGGMVLIEIADAQAVGTEFYANPQHLHPLTPRTLHAVLETLGFEDITTRHPADYALVCTATKPLPGT